MTTLIAFGAVVAAILGVLVYLYLAGRRAGSDRISAEIAGETADTLRRQGEAVVNAPQGKEAIVTRLREKGL